MDHNRAERTIAALTAIVQTMLPELYCDAPHNSRQPFDNALGDDDPLALAISETLAPDEITHAFAWTRAPRRSVDEEFAAIPVVPRLGVRHQLRVRTMLVASAAADEALMAALGARDAPRRNPERALDIGTRHFVEAMTNDALAHRADVRPNMPAATVDERIAALPEPWRTRTRRELETLKDLIATMLGRDRARAQ